MSTKRSRRILLAAILVVGGAVLLSGFLRTALDTTLLLADLAGIDAGWADIRPPASRRAIDYETQAGTRQADLYLTADTAGAGLVLVPGAAPGGRDDPRLVTLATALARSGFAVLVPDIESLRELRLSPATADEIAAAAVQLADLDVLPAGAGLGIGALSVAAGPA
ncbi:MAG: hypothetical protein RQ826_14675, partial [Xanthomonadales bacterium]|nr:hypothetical protein [Xanthomonadales bacterium]